MLAKTKKTKPKKKAIKANLVSDDEISTREMILHRSLELINSKGMIDFRIDTLSTSLGLSPGNITYHFSRKEDICVALWEQYLAESKAVVCSLTSLLDIKQLYLLNRVYISLNYKYRGVVVFRNADLGAMTRDIKSGSFNEEQHLTTSRQVMVLLEKNGYMNKDAQGEITRGINMYHYIVMRWCMNFAYQAYKPKDVESKIDYMALLSLHALYPTFSEKGRDEFAEILAKISAGKLMGDMPPK